MSEPWVLVLGANSDMAIAIAKRYASAGYNLYLASRDLEELNKTAADLKLRYAVEVKAILFDACDFASHADFYSILQYKPIGTIVAFGVMHEQIKAQIDFSLSMEMIESNYMGAVSILEIVATDLERRQEGFIVGISSVAGDRGRKSNYIYGSSKAALSTYLAGLRHRLAKSGITVLTVKPGFVATKMTAGLNLPKKLTAQADEVAHAVYQGVLKNRSVVYVKPIWKLIMLVIVHMPDFIFNKTKL